MENPVTALTQRCNQAVLQRSVTNKEVDKPSAERISCATVNEE
jgi:hypothetical protein